MSLSVYVALTNIPEGELLTGIFKNFTTNKRLSLAHARFLRILYLVVGTPFAATHKIVGSLQFTKSPRGGPTLRFYVLAARR